jgi:dipeptidase E
MKLLLTSAGITNPTLLNSLLKLAGKPVEELKIAFIPTAANIEPLDKAWLIDNLSDLRKAGFPYIDIVDIAAISQDLWQPRLETVDIIIIGGGHSGYLAEQIQKSGLAKALPELLQTRVYMGISAGSMVTGPDMLQEVFELVYPGEISGTEQGLHFVDFFFLPHLGSEYFTLVRKEGAEAVAKKAGRMVYALDDAMAIEVDGEAVTVVGEGEHIQCN